ncbi:MAG TPA: IS1380 family transposase [Solirubrobacteraceae bacterium]
MKVQRDGRSVTVEVTSDGEGLVSHAGSALLAQVADKSGLTRALSVRLAGLKQRASGHDPGRVVRDLAVMLADGGDCLADLGAVRDQDALFGAVASDSTAFRVVDKIASTPGLLDALADAHARAREHVWAQIGAPDRVTIDVDATLVTSHSDKEGAAGTYKGGYGFHPILAYCDETGEALAAILRPGNAGSNTAADHIAVIEDALAQVPPALIETVEIVVRADSAGATHEVLDFCREHRLRYTVGYELTDQVREAILQICEDAWIAAIATDGSERENGQIAEITKDLDLSAWPTGSRVIVRRERAHPGAQLSFTDHDGHRFQALLTDQTDPHIQLLERRQRERARAETQIRNDKDTGLRNLPFRDFEHNRVWLKLVAIAHDLLAWTRRLLLTGELASCEPKRLRYRLLHVAARLAFHARKATLRIHAAWPWAAEIVAAFTRARALPAPT